MKHVLSTHLFAEHRLTVTLLNNLQKAGINSVELFCARQHLDYRDKAQVRELGLWFRESGMTVHSVHMPMFSDDIWGRSGPHAVINILETTKSRRLEMVDEIKRALDLAEQIPFRYAIQHLGAGGEEFQERKIDAGFSALEELSLFARARDAQILLENIPNGHSSPERLIYFLEATHLKLGFCFDTGHANLGGGVAPAFELMKDRIMSTHIHDNDGVNDLHRPPLLFEQGTIDWEETMGLLRSQPDQYPLVLEVKESEDSPLSLESVSGIFSRLEEV